jgi:hypothetical protein
MTEVVRGVTDREPLDVAPALLSDGIGPWPK